ncbi:unnamed protein product [Caenorhabditis bovis]|uniref:Uncharacterized protein n=1 Tax=Caenorhabditis bovis TaxID=2654633 RepID=A0A8S1F371_9PELO|nr:unnamed protein product [Caenorhabditis bovis]
MSSWTALATLLLVLACTSEAAKCRGTYRELRGRDGFIPRRGCRGLDTLVGEEYWTTVGYDGQLRDGRTTDDFLVFPYEENNGHQQRNAFIGYWITRTKYGNGRHHESFGHVFVKPNGRVCGWFVGYEKESVEVCGGFRVLSKNRRNPNEAIPFEWVQGSHLRTRDTIGFHKHRIAKIETNPDEIFFGDAQASAKIFQGISPNSNEFIEVKSPDEFVRKVWLLKKKNLSIDVRPRKPVQEIRRDDLTIYSDPHYQGKINHPKNYPYYDVSGFPSNNPSDAARPAFDSRGVQIQFSNYETRYVSDNGNPYKPGEPGFDEYEKRYWEIQNSRESFPSSRIVSQKIIPASNIVSNQISPEQQAYNEQRRRIVPQPGDERYNDYIERLRSGYITPEEVPAVGEPGYDIYVDRISNARQNWERQHGRNLEAPENQPSVNYGTTNEERKFAGRHRPGARTHGNAYQVGDGAQSEHQIGQGVDPSENRNIGRGVEFSNSIGNGAQPAHRIGSGVETSGNREIPAYDIGDGARSAHRIGDGVEPSGNREIPAYDIGDGARPTHRIGDGVESGSNVDDDDSSTYNIGEGAQPDGQTIYIPTAEDEKRMNLKNVKLARFRPATIVRDKDGNTYVRHEENGRTYFYSPNDPDRKKIEIPELDQKIERELEERRRLERGMKELISQKKPVDIPLKTAAEVGKRKH